MDIEPSEREAAGFAYRLRKNGDVEVTHHGRQAAVLRGRSAVDFVAGMARASAQDAQQVMARVTGNYKRGNERVASLHPRGRT